MANKVLLKKSSVSSKVPLTTDLDYGELALNYQDEKLYFKNASNSIKHFKVTQETLTIGTGLSGISYNGTAAVTIAIDNTVATLDGIQTLTNKTLTSPDINGGTADALTSLSVRDTSAAFDVSIGATSSTALTGARSLTLDVDNGSRSIKLGGNLTLANNFTTAGNFALTLTTTGATNVTLPTTGTLATTGNLSQFASTTSAQLAGVISDETGSGVLVFGTSPTITTSIVAGSASMDVFNTTATTVNAFGAATTLSIGAATGTLTLNNASVVISGNLTVNGTTTTINATTISVDDKNIELGSVASPSDTTADGGGITLKGATDKTFNWVDATDAWTSSEHLNLATGKAYYINGTSVLSATTLGSGVTGSSLTSVGTISTGTWQGTAIAGQYGGTGVNNSGKTITLGGNLTTSGAFATTLTVTAATNVTLPTTGTLATLAGSESLTNKKLGSLTTNGIVTTSNSDGTLSVTATTGSGNVVLATSPTISGGSITGLTGLAIRDTSAAFDVTLAATSSTALTAGRTVTLDVVNAARTVKLAGNIDIANNFTTAGNFALTLTTTAATNVTLPTTGTLATRAGTESLSNKTLDITTTSFANVDLTKINFAFPASVGPGTVITITSPTSSTTLPLATQPITFSGLTAARTYTLPDANSTLVASTVTTLSSLASVGTITTGTWNATDIALGAGGTNASLTAVNGGVVYSTASAMAITSAGTAGQALVSAGAAAPVWTTLTLENIPDAWVKRSVKTATTANITLSAPQTIDGISVVAGDRVLVKDQTAAAENGIYIVAAGAWTRAADADSASELAGAQVAVDQGTANGGSTWDTDFKSTDTLGTTAMSWNIIIDSGRLVTAGATTTPAAVRYNGTTATAGQFYGGTTTPTGTTRLNYGGYFYPTFINLSGSSDTSTAATHYYVETGSDGFVRPKTLANVQTEIVTNAVLLARHAAGAFGYTTGAGGTVTQATSRTTAVTLNEYCGTITLFSTTTTAGQSTSFTFTNSTIAAGDRLILNHVSGGTLGAYNFACSTAAGSATISVYTPLAQGTAAAPVIGFVVVKAVTA